MTYYEGKNKYYVVVPIAIAESNTEYLNHSIHTSYSECRIVGANDEFYVIAFRAKSKTDSPNDLHKFKVMDTDEVSDYIDSSPEYYQLKIAAHVANGSAQTDTLTVTDGKVARIVDFRASSNFSKSYMVRAVWDYTGTPDVIWTISGVGQIPNNPTRTGDGSKVLAIEASNAVLSTSEWMSATMDVIVDDGL